MAFAIKLLFILYISLQVIPPNSSLVSKRSLLFGLDFIKSKAEAIIDKSVQHTKCSRDLKALIADLYRQKLWAYHMVDSSIKLNPGLLTGNVIQFGNFEQCLAINENRTGEIIKGQYCSVVVIPNRNHTEFFKFAELDLVKNLIGGNPKIRLTQVIHYLKLVLGVCIPESCSIQHLQTLWNKVEDNFNLPLHADFLEPLCSSKDKPKPFFVIDYYIYIFFAAILFIVILSTIYDLFCRSIASKKGNDVLVAFSLYTNSMKLLSSECENHNLTCMYGIKVISMIWVITGHRFIINCVMANINTLTVLEMRYHNFVGIIMAAPYAVDTFLTISGILVAYVKLEMGKEYNIPIWAFYMHRFIRLGPALLATILFYISILKHLGEGPFWGVLMKKLSGTCYATGWLNLLFLNNFINVHNQCIDHSWYLAVDSQFYAIAPFILYNFIKRPRGTLITMLIMGVLSILYTTFITIYYNLGALVVEFSRTYFEKIYYSPLCRLPPWLIGIFFGFLIHHCKTQVVKINMKMNLLLWGISLGILSYLIYAHNSLSRDNYSIGTAVFYNAFSKSIWALAICFIIFACSTGNGGFINRFLSAPIFIIIGKLNYSMYLIHVGVQSVLVGSQKQARHFSVMNNVHDALGDLVLVFILGAVFSLIFESPVFALLKILQKNTKKIDEANKEISTQLVETNVFDVFSKMIRPQVHTKAE